ncbi:MAG: protein kinase [Syntrophobacteraceae bacterium]
MNSTRDRRSHGRAPPRHPTFGCVHVGVPSGAESPSSDRTELPCFYVQVLDVSEKGALIESGYPTENVSRLFLPAPGPPPRDWVGHRARVAWTRHDPEQNLWLTGLSLQGEIKDTDTPLYAAANGSIPLPGDLDFLLGSIVLNSIPDRAAFHLLNCLRPCSLKAGDRLFSQGDHGDSLYLIQQGRCAAKLEKDNTTTHLACLQDGDVVGEMAVVTGEPRSAHVDAETDVRLWRLGRKEFQSISNRFPDLKYMLTELVTQRFEREARTGDRRIGKYIIKNKLGKGGWSIVYQGVHRILNAPVAIKMMKHNMAMEEGFLRKFRNEARIIAQMNHRNIVRVYDIEERFQTVFIVMEYLEGYALDSLLERLGRIPVPRAVHFLSQVCEGLAYAHGTGIIHQDIKPANLFVQAQDQIKILDFGLACRPGSEDPNLAGTIFYAAPEQIEGLPVDVRTDVYALGITAYEILTGARPYPEEDLGELIRLHLDRDIPDPCEVVPGLPASLCRFIQKCCRRNPDERYQTIEEALHDLRPLAAELCPSRERAIQEKTKAMNVFFLYRDEHQLALNALLERLGGELQDLGLVMKVSTFEDI